MRELLAAHGTSSQLVLHAFTIRPRGLQLFDALPLRLASRRPRLRSNLTLPPPTLRERRHRGLARRRVAVHRRAILMLPEGERPHPRRTNRRGCRFHDAADDNAVGEYVVIVIALLAGRARGRRAFEQKRGHVPLGGSLCTSSGHSLSATARISSEMASTRSISRMYLWSRSRSACSMTLPPTMRG